MPVTVHLSTRMTLLKILAIDSHESLILFRVYKSVYDERWKILTSQKKWGSPLYPGMWECVDRYQQNWGAMKNYVTKNQESQLKIEIIQFQMEDL